MSEQGDLLDILLQREAFEKFTERTRKVLALARQEALSLNHNYIGTEHLLLALTIEGEGVGAKALLNLGVEQRKVRSAIMFIVGRGDQPVAIEKISLVSRAKKVLELAVDEAQRMNHHYIGTEHLLLGILQGDGVGAGVLASLNVTLEAARSQVAQILESMTRPEGAGPKNNVITCRLDDRAMNAIDALLEAGIRTTRSDAASWLISAGIEAQRALFERVNATVAQIRQLRAEAQKLAQQLSENKGGPAASPASEPPAEQNEAPPAPPEATG